MAGPENKSANPLVQLLTSHFEAMGRAQKTVAEYLMSQTSTAAGLSLEQLADETNTSRATIIRLCKDLGLQGYRELQQYLMKSVLCSLPSGDRDSVVQWCFTAAAEAASETLSLLDLDHFHQAVQYCVDARFIVWYGLGDSGTLAQSGQHKCWVMGMESKAFVEPSSFVTSRLASFENDVLIVMSQSGDGDYLNRPVRTALNDGMPVIAITSNRFSWLAENATVSLFTATRKVFHEYGLISVRAGQEAVVNALVLKVAQTRGIPFSWRTTKEKGEWPKREIL